MSDETNDVSGVSSVQRNITIPILVTFACPALICFLFIFYHAIKLRKRLIFDTINNHIIFLILIFDFLSIATELPITLYYLAYGRVHTKKICLFWMFWDFSLQVASLFLTTYASIERYFLVFHRQAVLKHKFIWHYIPMFWFTVYIPIFFLCLLLRVPCQTKSQEDSFDLTAFACGTPCYFTYVTINTYDVIVNLMLPSFTILTFNLVIIIRVIASRTTALGSVALRKILKKNRRMILQLLGISLMSLIAWLPWVVITIAVDFFDPSFGLWFEIYILPYLPYLTTSMSPFFALIGLSEIRKQIIPT